MSYKLRDYQVEASRSAVKCFESKEKYNGLIVLPTGGGKSLLVADIASKLDSPLIVFQPSKELVEQNAEKMKSYGIDYGIYSASVGFKDIKQITLATIGSVMNHLEDFKHFRYVLIDECHLVSAKSGRYLKFIQDAERKVVGLTATPYRLASIMGGNSMLRFLTRTRPRVFDRVIYYCDVRYLVDRGYLAQLRYFDLTKIDMTRVKSNSTGADYDERSLREEYERAGFFDQLLSTTRRVLHPKNGVPRNGVLVFTRFVEESTYLVESLKKEGIVAAVVSGETPKEEREMIIEGFKSGVIQVVSNAQTLTTGFDYPALDTVILGRPTKSLALYYQIIGRAIRPYEGKDGWVIDLCGNYPRFGKVEDLVMDCQGATKWRIMSNGKQLTNTLF